jgi:hypothetical protein
MLYEDFLKKCHSDSYLWEGIQDPGQKVVPYLKNNKGK